MKILLVGRCVTSIPPRNGGGAEWHGYHLAKALDKLGHEVHYVTNYSEPLEFNGIITYNTYKNISPKEISRFPFMGFNKWILKHFKENILAARKAMDILKKEKNFDIIHCHGNLAALILSKNNKNIPVVYTEHDAPPWICTYRTAFERFVRKLFYYFINKTTMDNVSHIITISEAQRRFYVSKWNISEEKISTISNGVDTISFNQDNNGKYIKKKYSLPNDYCIFVGRLESRKGVDYLIRSLKDINISSVIVGNGPDKERLVDLSNCTGVSKRAIFIGSVSEVDLRQLYSNAIFFVSPSISEVGPTLTILEAMSSGIPVIANNIPGTAEIVIHGDNGFLIEPDNIDSLINAENSMINNVSLRQMMGQRARKGIEENYSWNEVARKVTGVYEKILCDY